jgi:HSP20 family protein
MNTQLKKNAEPQYVDAVPAVDVYENDKEILILVDLPGLTADQLKLELDNHRLDLEARQVPAYGQAYPKRFHRSFRVPETVDAAKVGARLNAGVLELRLTKSELKAPQRIAVASA